MSGYYGNSEENRGSPYGRSPEDPPQFGRRLPEDQGGAAYGASAGGSPYGSSPYGNPPEGSSYSGSPYSGSPYGGSAYGSPYGGAAGPMGPGGQTGPAMSSGPYTEKPKQSGTMLASLLLMMATGVGLLVGSFVVFASLSNARPAELVGDDTFSSGFWEGYLSELHPAEYEPAITGLGVMIVICALIWSACYITFAFVGTMGSNPGRITATVILSISAVSCLIGILFSWFFILFLLMTGAALVMLWLPPSSDFVRRRDEWKRFAFPRFAPGPSAPPGGYGYPPYR